MTAPPEVRELVERFRSNEDQYRSAKYNETQLRREFLDPLFFALGWDVQNAEGYAEPYKDVVHEDMVRIGGRAKAPDYSFRIGGVRKYFLEAKRPSTRIRDDQEAALQLRRYAWSAKLALSVLSNFAELSVYDCRIRPKESDSAGVARVSYFTFEDYEEKWSEIASVFSKTSILKGSFDKYAADTKRKRGTEEFDSAFLTEMEKWREALAKNFALRNGSLRTKQLNYAVQQTIDRIIFLRIAEDRGIESYGRLREAAVRKNVYQNLLQIFYQADARYNSGIFHFQKQTDDIESPDTFTPSLRVDDDVLRGIIGQLYYPQSSYEFSVVPPEILGQVYERFLGKVIKLSGRSASVEERPEVRKAGGIFYTPAAVVRYIVNSTIDPVTRNQTPAGISGKDQRKGNTGPLRVLDPACGSGSFLIQAYQYFLDWYLAQYTRDNPGRFARGQNPRVYMTPNGIWKLTIAERRRILLTHIYGVDIDSQAVEVTKLSLLLKVLEGESDDSIARQMDLFHQRALPDLGNNIKCGNSLIDPEYYRRQPNLVSDPEAVDRINAFDWRKEFHDVFDDGGFDVLVGNPPYRRELDYKHLMDEIADSRLGEQYRSPRMDLWYYFVHRGLELLKSTGRLGYIVNSYWTAGTGAEKLIEQLRRGNLLEEIFDFGPLKVFDEVSGRHMIILLRKARRGDGTIIKNCSNGASGVSLEGVLSDPSQVTIRTKAASNLFHDGKLNLGEDPAELINRLALLPRLDSIAVVRQGIAENPSTINRKVNKRFGNRYSIGAGVFMISASEKRALRLTPAEESIVKPYHDLKDIGRYYLNPHPSSFIIYSTRNTIPEIRHYPNLRAHLSPYRPIMAERRETKKGTIGWWHLHWPREESIWTGSKIVALQMGTRPCFAVADSACYSSFSTNVILQKKGGKIFRYAFTALLNSKVVWYWLKHFAKKRGVGLELNGHVLKDIPIPAPLDETSPLIKELAALAEERAAAEISRRNPSATPQEIASRNAQIAIIEQRIDDCAFSVYKLSEDERRSVETYLLTK